MRAPEVKTAEHPLPPERPEAPEHGGPDRVEARDQASGAALDPESPDVEVDLEERAVRTSELPTAVRPLAPAELAALVQRGARPAPGVPPSAQPAPSPAIADAPAPMRPAPAPAPRGAFAAPLAPSTLSAALPVAAGPPLAPPVVAPASVAMPLAPPPTGALGLPPPLTATPTLAAAPAARRSTWRIAAIAGIAITGALGLAVVGVLALRAGGATRVTGTLPAVAPAVPGPPSPDAVTPIPRPTAAPPTDPLAAAGAPTGTSAPALPVPPTAEALPPPSTVTPPAPEIGTPEPATPTATASTLGGIELRLPIGPSDPIQGRDEDFDLARFGITLAEPPASRRALTRRVSSLLAEGYRRRTRHDLDRAEEAYRSILSIDPENPRATAGLALVSADRGDAVRALVFAQRLTRLRPEYASNFVLLGDSYLAAGDRDAARRSFEHVLELEPGHAGAQSRLASLP